VPSAVAAPRLFEIREYHLPTTLLALTHSPTDRAAPQNLPYERISKSAAPVVERARIRLLRSCTSSHPVLNLAAQCTPHIPDPCTVCKTQIPADRRYPRNAHKSLPLEEIGFDRRTGATRPPVRIRGACENPCSTQPQPQPQPHRSFVFFRACFENCAQSCTRPNLPPSGFAAANKTKISTYHQIGFDPQTLARALGIVHPVHAPAAPANPNAVHGAQKRTTSSFFPLRPAPSASPTQLW